MMFVSLENIIIMAPSQLPMRNILEYWEHLGSTLMFQTWSVMMDTRVFSDLQNFLCEQKE